jgi:hypothetical protein
MPAFDFTGGGRAGREGDGNMKAWYFAPIDRKLGHGDGREIALGRTHVVEGPIVLCEHGLHASRDILDALSYASGPVLYEVELSDEIVEGDDKLAASERTYLRGGVDLSEVLCAFARWCALSVAHLWKMPEIVRRYLETGDESLRAAAGAAADAAASDAASDAARDAAWAAAWAAAWDAARAAAGDAAWAAAGVAAGDAARREQSAKLGKMVEEAWEAQR